MPTPPENPFDFEEQAPPGHAYEKLMPRSKRMTTAALILAAIVAWEAYTVWTLMLPARVATWPKAKGTVLRCELFGQLMGSLYRARIEYEFAVKGVRYKSDQITCDLDGRSRGSKEEVFPLVEAFPEGAEVEVFYDAGNPHKSYLLAQVSASLYVIAVGLVAAAAVVVAYLYFEWRGGRQESRARQA